MIYLYNDNFFHEGCRSASINLEARSLTGWSTQRHCVVAKLQDLTVDHFRNIRSKAGALLVILPEALHRLSQEDRKVTTPLYVLFLNIMTFIFYSI